MVKQLLNEPSLLSIVLSFLDGDALVILRSVVRLFYTATNDDRLWRFHLNNCSPALSTVASTRSKCREVLVQLLTGRPRVSLKQFTFCVDVRHKSDGNKVVLSAAEVLRLGEDGRVEVFVTNLLPAIAIKNGEGFLVDFNIEVYILDSRTKLYKCPFFYAHGGEILGTREDSWYFISSPVFKEAGEQVVIVVIVELSCNPAEQGSLRAKLKVQMATYNKLVRYYDEVAGGFVVDKTLIDEQLLQLSADLSERWLAGSLIQLFTND